jgi:hypothetical protein
MFGSAFLAYKQLLYKGVLGQEQYLQVLKYLIYAYCIMLLIQQFCVLTGLPVVNGRTMLFDSNPWKLNSLSAEPSHTSRIVALLMYSYIVIKQIIIKRKYSFYVDFDSDKWIWAGFLWTMLTIGSSTAFVFVPIVLLTFLRLKSILPLLVLTVLAVAIINFMGGDAYERTIKVLVATLSLDPATIIAADHSASLRIVPMMIIWDKIDLTTLNGWFGYGIDYVGTFLSSYIPGIPDGTSGGGLLQLSIEYGFVPFLLFIFFSFRTVSSKSDYSGLIFWFMLVFMYNINTQILWLSIVLLFTNKYFKTQSLSCV